MSSPTPGEIRAQREIERNAAQARKEAENQTAKPGNSVSGGSSSGSSLYGTLLGMTDPSILSALLGTGIGSNYGQTKDRAKMALGARADQTAQTGNLQNALLGEQLSAIQMQNSAARQKPHGSTLSGMGASPWGGNSGGAPMSGGMPPYSRRTSGTLPDVYANTQNREERGKDMALDRGDYQMRAKFDASLQQQMLEEEEKRKMELYRQILSRLGSGDTSRGTSTTTGGSYQNIGGRPVYMPTSETTNTSQTTPTSRIDILKLLDLR